MLTTLATALDDFTSVSVNCYLFVASLINTRAHFGRGGGDIYYMVSDPLGLQALARGKYTLFFLQLR